MELTIKGTSKQIKKTLQAISNGEERGTIYNLSVLRKASGTNKQVTLSEFSKILKRASNDDEILINLR